MSGVHERDVGSPFLYKVYHHGDVVRRGDAWGVVSKEGGNRYHSDPEIIWFTDNDAWTDPAKFDRNTYDGQNISAPYSFNYEGIPDVVLAKATEIKLKGSL